MKTIRRQDPAPTDSTASTTPELIEVGTAIYIAIEGTGRSGTELFYQKKKALRLAAQTLGAAFSDSDRPSQPGVTEIFYWYDEARTGFVNIGQFYTKVDLAELRYRMAITIPEYVTEVDIRNVLVNQTSTPVPFSQDMHRYTYRAGQVVQVLHLGPFAGELQTLSRLQRFAESIGYIKSGLHQEIHLTDFDQDTDQTAMRTILRDAVSPIRERMVDHHDSSGVNYVIDGETIPTI